MLDRLNSHLVDHHLRTAFLVDQLSRRLDLEPREHQLAVLSALIHDLGLVPLGLKPDDLLFERDHKPHSQTGWLLMRTCPSLAEESWLVRYHHSDWAALRHLPRESRRAGELGNLIRLADYLDISARTGQGPRELRTALKSLSGDIFKPDQAEAAQDLLFTPDLFPSLSQAARHLTLPATIELALSEDEALAFAFLFSKIADSRSPYTTVHSVMTAGLGLMLHQMAGGRANDAPSIYMAWLLHDVGMLGVPLEPLEKQGSLNHEEFVRVSEHAALTYQALSSLPGFYRVAVWAAYHHERIDGGGYPLGLTGRGLPLESKIIAVADVLAALTQPRPHRRALPAREALTVLKSLAKSRALDPDLVKLVQNNLSYFSVLQRNTHKTNQPFFQSLVKEFLIFAPDRLSMAWEQVLNGPGPVSPAGAPDPAPLS
jgi:HD-GYP domain-containing protein (c-di-GMP phosphodiesterase class II)